jgi:uncharacterized LabA/DUF88 family protein
MKRVISYIDGFNLYYGLRSKNWKWFYWLNIQEMAKHLLKPTQVLVTTKYFTTIVNQPADKHRRQAVFLEALQTLSDLEIYYGHFLHEDVTCWNCSHTYRTYHEKMTDVHIATELMADAFQNKFDTALLVSGDGDLVPPVRKVRQLFSDKRIVAVFPPNRVSKALKKTANAHTNIGRATLTKSVFPDKVTKPDGFILQRPATWK